MSAHPSFCLSQVLKFNLHRNGLVSRLPCTFSNLQSLLPLHATDQSTPFLSLYARLSDDFLSTSSASSSSSLIEASPITLDAFMRILLCQSPSKLFARTRSMRGTLHIVSREQLSALQTIYGRLAFRKIVNACENMHEETLIGHLRRSAEQVVHALAENGPLSTPQIKKMFAANVKM